MARYRRKPVEIEAEIYRPGMEDGFFWEEPFILTPDGRAPIEPGDFIVTESPGVRRPMRPDLFIRDFEPVPDDPPQQKERA